MLNITITDTTPTKELASATSLLKEMYKTRREQVMREVIDFLRAHSDEAFTAREISNSCGLTVQSITNYFRDCHCVDSRERKTSKTYYAVNENGVPDYNEKTTVVSTVNEYFYRESRRGW